MKLPNKKKVNILGFKFELIFSDTMSDTELGRCDYTDQKIYISTKQGEDSLKDTLLHEIIHGITYLMGLKDEDTEESFVARISTGLRSVFNDNPWLILIVFSK